MFSRKSDTRKFGASGKEIFAFRNTTDFVDLVNSHVGLWWEQLTGLRRNFPSLPYPVVRSIKSQLVLPMAHVFEFGGGRSTAWFSKRAAQTVVAENDPEWQEFIAKNVPTAQLHRVTKETMASAISSYPRHYFDLVIVDTGSGIKRDDCVSSALPHLRCGGFLIVDDTDKGVLGDKLITRLDQRLDQISGVHVKLMTGWVCASGKVHEAAVCIKFHDPSD